MVVPQLYGRSNILARPCSPRVLLEFAGVMAPFFPHSVIWVIPIVVTSQEERQSTLHLEKSQGVTWAYNQKSVNIPQPLPEPILQSDDRTFVPLPLSKFCEGGWHIPLR